MNQIHDLGTKLLKRYSFLGVGLVLYSLGLFLYGAPKNLQMAYSLTDALGPFLIFLFFTMSCLGAGKMLFQVLKISPAFSVHYLSMGSAVLSLLIFLVGITVGFGPSSGAFLQFALIFFLCFPPELPSLSVLISSARRSFAHPFPSFFLGLFALLILLASSKAFVPNMHWDALWYNLPGPRSWFHQGRISFDPHNMVYALCSTWEHLYLWPILLLSSSLADGQIAIHLFCQWIHFFWGVGGVLLLMLQLLKANPFRLSHKLAHWPALLAGLTSFGLAYTAFTPKNDWGVMFWFLSSLSMLEHPLVASLLLGFSLTAKMSYFYLLPLVFLWVAFAKPAPVMERLRRCGTLALFTFLGCLPIFLRNSIWTGNPFFPNANFLFHQSLMGPTWVQATALYEGTGSWHWSLPVMWDKWVQVFPPGQPFTYLFFLPLLPLVPRSLRILRPLVLILLIPLILFFLFTGPRVELRILGPLIFSIFFLSLVFLFKLVEEIHAREWQVNLLLVAATFYVLHVSDFDLKDVQHVLQDSSYNEFVAKFPGGRCNYWLREKRAAGERVLFMNDTRTYYFMDLDFLRPFDDPQLDSEMHQASSLKEKLAIMARHGVSFLYEVPDPIDHYFDKPLWLEISALAGKIPAATVYQSRTCRLLSLKGLIGAL